MMLEVEMTDALGAEKGARTAARLGYRSGYYTRTLVNRVGKLELRVDRDGRFSTELFQRYLAPSRRWWRRWRRCMCRGGLDKEGEGSRTPPSTPRTGDAEGQYPMTGTSS